MIPINLHNEFLDVHLWGLHLTPVGHDDSFMCLGLLDQLCLLKLNSFDLLIKFVNSEFNLICG